MKILFIMHTSLLDGSTFSLFNLMRELQKKCVEMVLVIPGNNKLSDDFIQNEYRLPDLEKALLEHAEGKVIKNCIIYD